MPYQRFLLVFLLTISTPAFGESPAGILPPERDPWGNVYPRQCSRLATDKVKLTEIIVSNLPIKAGTKSRCGYYDTRFDPPLIYLLKTCIVDGRTVSLAETQRHERCHHIMAETTGSPEWHP